MKRLFDLFFLFLLLVPIIPISLLLIVLIKFTSKGPILHWSSRVGKNNKIFKMPKFRTMKVGTPNIASHLMDRPEKYLYPFGSFLRKTSLDEIPQMFSILKGDMSFVGPRPALFNQYDLVDKRMKKGISKLTPGITGWAQINGRDSISIEEKVNLDHHYLLNQSFFLDIKIILITIKKVFLKSNILH